MLSTDVMMSHAAGFVNGKLQNPLGSGREFRLRRRGASRSARHALDQFLDTPLFQTEFTQHTPGDTSLFADQPQQQVFRSDVVVLKPFGFFLRQTQNAPRSLRKALHLIRHGQFTSVASVKNPPTAYSLL